MSKFKLHIMHAFRIHIYIYAHTKHAYKSLVTSREKPSHIGSILQLDVVEFY